MPYAEKMASKSTSFVLDVTNDDPSTSHGMTNVLLRLSEYTSPISSSGEVSKILPVNGDQGLVALARSQVACRSGEDAPQRLSCLLPHIMDWHARKVNLILSYPHPRYGDIYLKNVNMSQKQENLGLYRQIFDLEGQVNEPGSVSNIKTVTTFIAMRNIYVGIFDGIPLKPYFSGLPSYPGGQEGEKLLPQRFPASCDH